MARGVGRDLEVVVQKALRDFHLAGVDLETEAKDRFKAIMQELAEAQAEFEHNVQDASDAWSLNITSDENLRGLPDSLLARAADAARQAGADGWLFSLDFPTYDAVMRQAESRDLRETLGQRIAFQSRELRQVSYVPVPCSLSQ